MTIDPKAAELAKALADAVAAQQTEEYQALAEAAKRKDAIDAKAVSAAYRLREYYTPTPETPTPGDWTYTAPAADHLTAADVVSDVNIFGAEPERYELPDDETMTARPNGGLSD